MTNPKTVVVQGHQISAVAVQRLLDSSRQYPRLRGASFYLKMADGTEIDAKQVIYQLADGLDHWGNEAAQALLKLGFTVYVRKPAKAHHKPPYASYLASGQLILD